MMKTALGEAEKKTDPFEARQREINTAREKQAQENVTGLEAIQKQFSDIYKGKRDRQSTREGEIAKMESQGLGLAAVLAGATIMGTRGSVGEAISAGIGAGTKQYITSMDKINSAKEKLSDARDRLDELEAQRGELSARELHKARNDVKTITTAGMEDLVKAAMAERKMNRTEAIAFVTAQLNANLKVYEQQQANKRNAASVAATQGPGQQERLFSTLGGGDVLKGMQVYSENMGTESKGMEATLQAYIKNPMELKATNPQLAAQLDAILQQRMASMSVTDKPLAKVRTQP
jgi:hypothetical protein